VADLSLAQRQMVEVAKALSQKAQVIALDEPTSSLTERETETLFGLMRALKAQGVTLIFISHRLEELFEVADVVTVLRDGQGVGTARVQDVTPADVVRMMVGRELGDMYPKASTPGSEVVLRAQGLRRGKDLRGVDLELRRGEVLGLAGLVGAGRTFVARALFGADPVESGEIWLEGRPVRMRSPEEAIRRGIGFVPEDRKSQALFLALAVRINLAIRQLQRVSHFGLLDFSALDRLAGSYVQRLGIRTPSLLQRVRNLSGGNQQKVVIARWLTIQPKVLILDEPTRGIDVGTKAEIHALIDELAKQGVAILMISSELPEILGISDRVLVMHEGQVVAEFARGQATQDAIMHAATGGGNRVS
jgi:ribose transport system ATP-binding protein